MKNILVITASPRLEGNSDLMADAFIEGAKQAGHSVVKFQSAFKNIKSCRHCDKCFSAGRACVFEDDFRELSEYIQKADVIAFCTPLYWYTFPSAIKAAIDKFYSFFNAKQPLHIKKALLLACAGDNDPKAFDGIKKTYEDICKYNDWESLCVYTLNSVYNKGDIKDTNALNEAKQIGLNLK